MKLKISGLILAMLSLFYGQAQVLNLPAASPKAAVMQQVGVTEISVTYSRPGVKGRKIWGTVVPYGMQNLGWGTAKAAPWRAGADWNTVLSLSTAAVLNGQKVAAGKYAFFVEVHDNNTATAILSSKTDAWGSYFYDENEVVATFPLKMMPHDFTEWLEYRFSELKESSVTLALNWENISMPISIEVDAVEAGYQSIVSQLKGTARFTYRGVLEGAQYCLQHKVHLDQAMLWIDEAIRDEKSFATLSTKAALLKETGKAEEAEKLMDSALPMATTFQLHAYGRQLIADKKPEKALEVFKLNAKLHPNEWPVNYGLARGYSAMGDFKKATEALKKAEMNCPDEQNRLLIIENLKKLENKQDIN